MKSFTFWLRLVRLVLVGLFLWQLRLFQLLNIIVAGFQEFLSNGYYLPPPVLTSLLTLLGWSVLFIMGYVAFIFWFAQFILPVSTWRDRLPAAWRLFLFSMYKKWHGAAVFVRNGKIDASLAELDKTGPGVAFVDLRSAIALDKQLDPKRGLTPVDLEQPQRLQFDPMTNTYVSNVRVAGPGLTFTGRKEKIKQAVDLRKQTRSRTNVQADTRDGIRIKTSVSCVFTLGEPADVLDVCLGGQDSKQVLVVQWDEAEKGEPKKIKSLAAGELDPGDEKEIYEFLIGHPEPANEHEDDQVSDAPYMFDQKRVEQAIYFETSTLDPASSAELAFKKWSEWPQDVATEKFRILLAQWPYLKLYSPDDPDHFPLQDLRREVSRQVRNTGILAYRGVMLRNGGTLKVDGIYPKEDLAYTQKHDLLRFDVLRDRGIKVLSAGFGDLEPIEASVRHQLVESWQSAKQKEADLKVADYHLEIVRIKNQARVRAQQNMIYHLTQLLENQEYPREALALLIFQELEAAAANPETRKLLPADTLSLLTGIGTMLLPADKNSKGQSSGIPIMPYGEGE